MRKRRGSYRRRRRSYKKRRVASRRRGLRRFNRVNKHSYIRSRVGTLTYDFSAGNIFIGWNFTLNDVPNVSEFTGLYDQYCIRGVKLTLWLEANAFSSITLQEVSTSGIKLPTVFWARDYDDSNSVTLDSLLQYPFCGMRRFSTPIKIFVRPKPSMKVYNTLVSDAAAVPKGQTWIDCSSPSVPHYGIKMIVDPGTQPYIDPDQIKIRFMAKYYIGCKNVR